MIPLTFATKSLAAASVTVDSSASQSLNRALSELDKHTPITVSVNGTCAEYVQINGFDGLTLKALIDTVISTRYSRNSHICHKV